MRISINETKLFKKLIEQIYNVKINILPRGITIDSRLHESGDVYLPIVGKNFDGHEFISSVVKNNPSLIFSEKELKLICDGQHIEHFTDESIVKIRQAKNHLKFITFNDYDYYQTLKTKMVWGKRGS